MHLQSGNAEMKKVRNRAHVQSAVLGAQPNSHGFRFLKVFAASSFALALVSGATGHPFQLPTANRALLEQGKGPEFFVGTSGKSWETGTFGCVRSSGAQLHEGLDIRALKRDKRGEPTDAVLATAEGTVAYVSRKPGLSNYGNYIVLRHFIDGLEIYSLYAHMAQIRAELRPGDTVGAGEQLGILGRTANTHEGISRDRAHLHFELDFLVNDGFSVWYKKRFPGQKNDHGNWNGHNLVGIDPAAIFLAQKREGSRYNLVKSVQERSELCRVLVRKTRFPWLKRCQPLVRPNPVAEKDGIAGYEMALDFNGVAFELIPRAASEIKAGGGIQLLSVNETEAQKEPARHLVARKRGKWQLTQTGLDWLELLTW